MSINKVQEIQRSPNKYIYPLQSIDNVEDKLDRLNLSITPFMQDYSSPSQQKPNEIQNIENAPGGKMNSIFQTLLNCNQLNENIFLAETASESQIVEVQQKLNALCQNYEKSMMILEDFRSFQQREPSFQSFHQILSQKLSKELPYSETKLAEYLVGLINGRTIELCMAEVNSIIHQCQDIAKEVEQIGKSTYELSIGPFKLILRIRDEEMCEKDRIYASFTKNVAQQKQGRNNQALLLKEVQNLERELESLYEIQRIENQFDKSLRQKMSKVFDNQLIDIQKDFTDFYFNEEIYFDKKLLQKERLVSEMHDEMKWQMQEMLLRYNQISSIRTEAQKKLTKLNIKKEQIKQTQNEIITYSQQMINKENQMKAESQQLHQMKSKLSQHIRSLKQKVHLVIPKDKLQQVARTPRRSNVEQQKNIGVTPLRLSRNTGTERYSLTLPKNRTNIVRQNTEPIGSIDLEDVEFEQQNQTDIDHLQSQIQSLENRLQRSSQYQKDKIMIQISRLKSQISHKKSQQLLSETSQRSLNVSRVMVSIEKTWHQEEQKCATNRSGSCLRSCNQSPMSSDSRSARLNCSFTEAASQRIASRQQNEAKRICTDLPLFQIMPQIQSIESSIIKQIQQSVQELVQKEQEIESRSNEILKQELNLQSNRKIVELDKQQCDNEKERFSKLIQSVIEKEEEWQKPWLKMPNGQSLIEIIKSQHKEYIKDYETLELRIMKLEQDRHEIQKNQIQNQRKKANLKIISKKIGVIQQKIQSERANLNEFRDKLLEFLTSLEETENIY